MPFRFIRYDLTAPWEELRDLFFPNQINAVLHLALHFNPIHDETPHPRIDVDGLRNSLRAAKAPGLKRILMRAARPLMSVRPTSPSRPFRTRIHP